MHQCININVYNNVRWPQYTSSVNDTCWPSGSCLDWGSNLGKRQTGNVGWPANRVEIGKILSLAWQFYFWTQGIQLNFQKSGISSHWIITKSVRRHCSHHLACQFGHGFIQQTSNVSLQCLFGVVKETVDFCPQTNFHQIEKSNGQMSNTCQTHDKPRHPSMTIDKFRL